jgi:hypothetical protein
MRTTHGLAAALAGMLLGGAGCTSEPCPKDDQLIERFNANRAGFERLVQNPGDQDLRRSLGIGSVQTPPGGIHFGAWSEDFLGVGGVIKGYAHYEEPPTGDLVDDIDANSRPGSPEEKLLYRQIEGPWYLYYASSN